MLVGLAATLGSGFLIGTGAFDVTTTSFTMVKDKVLLPYITLQATICCLTNSKPRLFETAKTFQRLQ
jgi:hypothetical protein